MPADAGRALLSALDFSRPHFFFILFAPSSHKLRRFKRRTRVAICAGAAHVTFSYLGNLLFSSAGLRFALLDARRAREGATEYTRLGPDAFPNVTIQGVVAGGRDHADASSEAGRAHQRLP